jgi:hypothetical protein
MSPPIGKVTAGELITAQLMNRIIEALNALERKVAEFADAVVIDEVSPPGDWRMGEQVTVRGRNFGLPSQNKVTVASGGSIRVTLKSGSSDRLLLFDVPQFEGVPASGADGSFMIESPLGSAMEEIRILPPRALPQGQILVGVAPPQVAAIEPGRTYDYTCTVKFRTTESETFALTATAGTAQTRWAVAVTDASQTPLSELFVPTAPAPGVDREVHVRITVPANASGAATMSLTATSKRNPQLAGAGDAIIQVGQPPEAPPTYSSQLQVYDFDTQALLVPVDGLLTLKPAGKYYLQYAVDLPAAPAFLASMRVLAGGALWDIQPGFSAEFPMSAQGQRILDAVLTPASGAPATVIESKVVLKSDPTKFSKVTQRIALG